MAGIPPSSLNYSVEAWGKNSIRSDERSNNQDVPKLLNSTSNEEPNIILDVNTADLEENKK